MSNRQDALAEMKSRCEEILVDNGFQTDAGQLVFFGERPVLSESDPEAAIGIQPSGETRKYNGEQAVVTLTVDLVAHVKVEADDAGGTLEALIADIKKAVEIDRDLGGTVVNRGLEGGDTRPLEREPGSNFVGAVVSYVLTFPEVWGNP